MNDDLLHLLVKKYIDGSASVEEEQELLDWYHKKNEQKVAWGTPYPDEEDKVRKRMFSNILASTHHKKTNFYYKWYNIAAVLLITVSIGLLSYNYLLSHREKPTTKQYSSNNLPGKPGVNSATLTLANGEKIVLSQSLKGIVAKQGGISIKKNSAGNLIYDLSAQPATEVKSIGFNTLCTARGQQYEVVLPDGSHVWLNAASSIKFPTAFTGDERKVELIGEAYFEVAKNKAMPFIVTVNDTKITVLGTHFNIMGYAEEGSTNATLLEGSVKVTKGNVSKIIIPGQQARVKNDIKVTEVNTDQAIAWKNGNFNFNDEDIHTLMNKIARWYDMDIIYEPGVTNPKFGGEISRYKDVSEILKKLELTQTIHFKQAGRRITVMN